MSNKKQLVCVFIPVLCQNEVYLLGAKNKVKSNGKQNDKEIVRTLINGTIEKSENAIAAAKRVIYDKFDILLGIDVPATVYKVRTTDVKEVHYVFIDKLFNFEAFPLVNLAADVQEVILVNEDTALTYEGERNALAEFLDDDDIDEKFAQWEENSFKVFS